MKILLAIDGSPPSAEAIHSVVSQPWPEGSEVRVFSAVELPYPPGYVTEVTVLPPPPAFTEAMRHEVEGMVASVSGMLHQRGISAHWTTRVGSAGRSIVDEAAEWGADLIVLGSHGRTGFKRFWMGSVARWVVDHAKCSVEVARSPSSHEEPASPH